MPNPPIRMLTENLPEERVLQAIFREEWSRGLIEIQSFLTPSAALGVAEFTRLRYPDRPVALVLNSGLDDPIRREERRDTIHRILSNASPIGWHVSLAVPDVDAWLMADPAVRVEFEAEAATRFSRHERAARIGQIAQTRPIDREAIGRASPDFRSLCEFIGDSVLASPRSV